MYTILDPLNQISYMCVEVICGWAPRFIFNTRSFKPTVESMMHLNQFQPRLFYLSGAFFQFWWRHLPIPFESDFYRRLHKIWEGRRDRPLVDMHAFRFAAQVQW